MKTLLSKPYFVIPLALAGILVNGALLIGGLSLLAKVFAPAPTAEVVESQQTPSQPVAEVKPAPVPQAGSPKSKSIKSLADLPEIEVEIDSVTLEEYVSLKPGFSYENASLIIGEPGQEMSRVEVPGTPVTVMYSWQNTDGSNMNATFQDNKLVTKAQFGLQSILDESSVETREVR